MKGSFDPPVAGEHRKFLLFKLLIVVGFALGVVLLIQSVATYRYVSGALMIQEAERESQRKVNTLVGAVRSAQTQDIGQIDGILQDFLDERKEQVLWIRIVDEMGKNVAAAGQPPVAPVPRDKLPRPFSGQTPAPEPKQTDAGPVWVSLRGFRTVPLGTPSPGSSQRGLLPGQRGTGPAGVGRRQPLIGLAWNVEIAVFSDSISASFVGLRRNLAVGLSASLALMGALVLIAIRFPYYLLGQQIEREINLARRVQADLLPSREVISHHVEASAQCISAWQVGGDFCDVFELSEDRTALVVGDVSGKGISAALLMALIYGAIHSVSWARSTADHVTATRQLNALLCMKTAIERFTSLFWGCFDPQRSTIQYVNAGHHPPLLFRMREGEVETQRLETGGPVLGLLPEIGVQQGEQVVVWGDLFVAFSDGIVEAVNESGEEFGEGRLVAVVMQCWGAPVKTIGDAIFAGVKQFTRDVPIADDQTLVVVRFKESQLEFEIEP
jgi:hypothetical protein